MNPLRTLILAAAGNDTIRHLVATAPVSRDVVRRFVAGETTQDAVHATRGLVESGLSVTLDYLGEDTTDRDQAERTVQAYLELLDKLHSDGLADRAEVSVKLSAVGQALDERLALENASRICAAAEQAGTTVTLDMEDHTTTDSTLGTLRELRRSWPWVGGVLQSYLHRTLDDATALSGEGSRIRLCKGAYNEPESVAYIDQHDVDLSYVRCANALLSGEGYPMFATHDPRLIEIIGERARWYGRKPGSYEYQMLYGVRPDEQRRLAGSGETVRVYIPYGEEWYGYLMRRMAERPANTAFFLRSLVSKS
ncbi:proline dehydrogenase [Longimycelium tulufanense]|uniref:proline dehydrogenase n=1 Tax=Longimycelium tulufanense TaxID=907463 RepID=A0A8J3FWV8_9PSEU|nr:proline dehydrogenase family protein [Longimycelium tulufanense]GGM69712.1 proline dehydrogenase [Longimycelium tulufanense]